MSEERQRVTDSLRGVTDVLRELRLQEDETSPTPTGDSTEECDAPEDIAIDMDLQPL